MRLKSCNSHLALIINMLVTGHDMTCGWLFERSVVTQWSPPMWSQEVTLSWVALACLTARWWPGSRRHRAQSQPSQVVAGSDHVLGCGPRRHIRESAG